VYEQLGKSEGPSVLKKVILAFLLPMVVFVASLAVFEKAFAGLISAGQGNSALSFAAALLVTFLCIIIARVIAK